MISGTVMSGDVSSTVESVEGTIEECSVDDFFCSYDCNYLVKGKNTICNECGKIHSVKWHGEKQKSLIELLVEKMIEDSTITVNI